MRLWQMTLAAGWVALSALAQAQSAGQDEPNGSDVFKRACAMCHVSMTLGPTGPVPGTSLDARAVPQLMLRQFTPEAILNALVNGKMQAQGAALTDAERRAVAEFASGRAFSSTPEELAAAAVRNACRDQTPMPDPSQMPSWNGWGNGLANNRYQARKAAKLTAADLPRLKLKWAFGYANVSSARTQPAVVGGRLFVASENGEVHALNAKTGCQYWTYKGPPGSGVVSALIVAPYKDSSGSKSYAVYFGDRKGNVSAVDANTGKLVWTRRVDEHPLAGITGAPIVYDGRVFVGVQGIGEEGRGATNDYACCTFRGSVVALDANNGEVVWKTYTIDEPKPRGKNKNGVQLFGPAGGSIWSSPTVDVKRGLIYVATGNGYTDPPQPTTDAILALDIRTGAIKWVRQATPNDSWAMGCPPKNPDNPACPEVLGPDYDFSAAPALVSVKGRDLIVVPQKSGMAYALDPDKQGEIVWEYRFGKGSGLGGQWGGATDGVNAYFGTADLLTPTPGGMHAVRLADGQRVWHVGPQPRLCGDQLGCSSGQGGPLTLIEGAVLNAGMDGGLRAYSTKDGKILWTYDTNRTFETVNGVRARGGSMDMSGPVVADGMLYVNSGYASFIGTPGNVLLAFGLD
jgi:polyvinyl alcohol dehydrogenase (cytochrome)